LVTKGGTILGHWRRTRSAKAVSIAVRTYEPLSERDLGSLRAEAKRFGAFYDREVALDLGAV
jgi:hypothetical protein